METRKDRIITGDARDMPVSELGKYRIMVIDPPWEYNDIRKIRKDGATPTKGIGACHQYDMLSAGEIAAMPVGELAAERCHLYLWATCPLLPLAFDTLSAWGFTYATVVFVWVKTNPGRWARALRQAEFVIKPRQWMRKMTVFNPGFYTGSNVELVLLGRRGKPFRHAEGCKPSQVIYAPLREHSQKPEEMQDLIEYMHPGIGPRLELFARRPRRGWDVFGNQVNKLKEVS